MSKELIVLTIDAIVFVVGALVTHFVAPEHATLVITLLAAVQPGVLGWVVYLFKARLQADIHKAVQDAATIAANIARRQ